MRKCSIRSLLLMGITAVIFLLAAGFSMASEPVSAVVELRVAAQMLDSHPLLFVAATISDDIPLPVQVPIALPAGAQPEWVGELTDGEAGDDPETAYVKLETRDGWDIYVVDLTASRTLQIEASMTEPYLVAMDASSGVASLSYVPATDADLLIVAVELPSTVVNFDQTLGYEVFAQGISGGMIVGPTFQDAKADQTYSASLNFETGTTADDTAAGPVDSTNTVLIVLVLALLGLIALFLIIWSRHNAGPWDAGSSTKTSHSSGSGKKASGSGGSHKGRKSAKKALVWNSPQVLIPLVIALAAIGLLVWTSVHDANTITENDGVYSQVFSVGDPCQAIDFALTDAAMQDPKDTARTIFDAIRASNVQILNAALDSNNGFLNVEFCESYTDPMTVAALIEGTGLVAGSSLRTLNTPIVLDDGQMLVYLSQNLPCVTNTFSVRSPGSDAVAFVQKLARAVSGVPSMTGVTYDGTTATATFGFCEEQTTDEAIGAALEAAGIDATLKSEAAVPNLDDILAQ
ncbi:MAG: hypothetical protein FWD41_02095 [Actinomycetia bacterium]|nr:hypothetical protein [Actinomycetes bacterium]